MADGTCLMTKRSRRAALGALAFLALGALVLHGCDDPPPAPGLEKVVMGGAVFWLEPALDEPTRIKGLGGRTSIEAERGMLFVFPVSMPLEFVMRDCVIDIDIAFLDDAGRIVQAHTMKVEEPKREGESANGYEARLKRYASRFPARFAVEVAAGTLDKLGVKAGDIVTLDVEGLKRRVK